MREKIPLGHALLWITLSLILVSGSAFFAFLSYRSYQSHRQKNPQHNIQAVVQSNQSGPTLSNRYLTELLGLSSDIPVNLYTFNTESGAQVLNSSPHIKEASIAKIKPGTLYISYKSREPIACLADLSNTALDRQGVIFPIEPFLEKKNLPLIYLGLEEIPPWGEKLKDTRMILAIKMLNLLQEHPVSWIDLSGIQAKSCGHRQIVLQYGGDLLRLNPDDYLNQIRRYIVLREKIQGNKVVDLRINDLAYLSDRGDE